MIKVIGITIESDINVGYIYYTNGKIDKTLTEDGFNADLDIEGNVVGIELLSLKPAAILNAKLFAVANDLDFPEVLERH